MNKKIVLNIWGRQFELSVIYQNFPGEDITDSQKRIVDTTQNVDFSPAKDFVIQYIRKNDADKVDKARITNIFRYVIPKSILIPRKEGKSVFALMCDYKFDMEHGLAIVFENEKYKVVGPQDIIL